MHTQTESTEVQRHRSVMPSGLPTGLSLYLLTISGEVMLGASVRWLLAYLGATIAGKIVPLGARAEGLAWATALAPIAWSLAGLALPGRGRVWGRRLGARRPTSEEAAALEDALAMLRGAAPDLSGAARYRVLDDPLPGAAVRGRTLILSRGLHHYTYIACVVPKLKHRSLKAAKELLRRKECLPGAVTRAYGAKKSARVVRQGHKPKTILPPGSKVSIRLAG